MEHNTSLTEKDLIVGEKYIAIYKSDGDPLDKSNHLKWAKKVNQPFLFYKGKWDNHFLFGYIQDDDDGDFFLPSDMQPYKEHLTEAEVYICLNCKEYDTQNVVCKNCGYKSFGETHPSNIVHVKAEVSKEEEKFFGIENVVKESDLDKAIQIYGKEGATLGEQYGFKHGVIWQKEQDRALISELLNALKSVLDCDNKLNVYTDRQLVNFCKEVSKEAITKAEKHLNNQ